MGCNLAKDEWLADHRAHADCPLQVPITVTPSSTRAVADCIALRTGGHTYLRSLVEPYDDDMDDGLGLAGWLTCTRADQTATVENSCCLVCMLHVTLFG